MHYRPVPTNTEEDISELVMSIDKKTLCDRKLPLGVGVLLLLVAVGLLVPMIYFTVTANSKACVDGLQAQKECQEVNQHVQRQLTQAQEFSHKKEAEAATCNHTMVTLRESLKKEQAQVAEFQGKFKILNQNLKDALAEVERLRSERSPPPPPRGTPLSPNSRPPGHGAKNLDAQATKFKSQPRPICHTATGGGGRCSLFSAAICREGVQVLRGEALSGPSGPGSCLSGPDLYSRRQSETCFKNNASSCSSFLFVVIAVLVLNALLT
uniref:Bone marrow stromal cell antigen 2 n=1 Tax=Bos indicus x Bos taurus TaxID=30522 RepID=A0A4W2HSW6_BOBOX